ncbi:MAG TPA: FkbM family methyltransferase [Puia sp.]|nr:FkbM family methyltransferase [Puia sp.]
MKNFLIRNFPSLGKYKRFLKAFVDSISPVKTSYSQYQEDKYILGVVEQLKAGKEDNIYIDVGANHPTDISNTYLFYKKGYSGIVIEPNKELIHLFNIFRKRDIALEIGCGKNPEVLPFYISPTPVISSFKNADIHFGSKRKYTAVLPLDIAIQHIDIKEIFLVSIDVEGMNYEVLQGAMQTIIKSKIICVEFDSDTDKEDLISLISDNFKPIKEMYCNLIFINKRFLHLFKEI